MYHVITAGKMNQVIDEVQLQRKAFSRQPARAVLVDFRPPMDSGTCLNMVQALTDTLMLACNLTGSVRIPLFSLITLGLYPEALYPLQSINGNRVKLLGALRELKVLCSSTLPVSSRSCLSEGIDEALIQLRRQQSLNNSSNSNTSSQLEITIVTAISSSTVAHQLSSLSNCPTLECVKRIQVLCVHEGERMLSSEQEDELNLLGEDHSELLASLLDILPIENDVLSFQSVFQCWLHDCNMDSEHLCLLLPAATDGDEVTVRCDLYERILDPVLLPTSLSSHYLLTSLLDHTMETTKQQPLLATGHTQHVPRHKLRAVSLIASGGVCESVLYGMVRQPLLLCPSHPLYPH
ncbi:meiosis 1 arrest protein-like [Dysidea avara]|uniref:meiosis 1 arrest protein-like n=1 Tax=Dysidea avara TaxID=196820 RepID=UPI00332C0ABE